MKEVGSQIGGRFLEWGLVPRSVVLNLPTGITKESDPGTRAPFLCNKWLITSCMIPANDINIIGTSSWQRLVATDFNCNDRSLRNYRKTWNILSCYRKEAKQV